MPPWERLQPRAFRPSCRRWKDLAAEAAHKSHRTCRRRRTRSAHHPAPHPYNARMSKPSRTRFRKFDGILLLDKPRGLSSNQALQRVRHLFRAEKAGHTGSLDPLAPGLLPVCFGEATKSAGGRLGARKAYDTVARLGHVTDTDDADGQLLRERPVPALSINAIDAALRELTGRIRQR